jgi:putative transposase
LDDFVLMPNHFHAIVWLSRDGDCRGEQPLAPTAVGVASKSIGALVGGFKAAVTTRCNRLNLSPNKVIWQRNYYEHVIRNDESLIKIREYIANNPAQWALDKYNYGNR